MFQLFLRFSLQLTKGVDGGRLGMGVKLYHVYSENAAINREPNVHFRELAARAGMNLFFRHILDPNLNCRHMVRHAYASHLSWYTCQSCGWEANGKERQTKRARESQRSGC